MFSCVGCGGEEDLKKQIAELTAQVQTLETALKTEQDKNAENQAKLDDLQSQVVDFEKTMGRVSGTLHTFDELYELGMHSVVFQHIAYFRRGKVTILENGEEKEMEFRPVFEQPRMSVWLEIAFTTVILKEHQNYDPKQRDHDHVDRRRCDHPLDDLRTWSGSSSEKVDHSLLL